MTRSERAEFVLRKLTDTYPNPPIPLDHEDAYTLLIAVLLSAQCTDVRVNMITPLLFQRAKNPTDMVKLSIDEIREIIRPCGLSPQKSKAIWNLSRILLDKHGGEVPRSLEELEELPGVGHKTAQVVMAQAYEVPSFPVDTHIHRLAFRWGLSDGTTVEKTERDLKEIFPEETWNKLHLQIIYWGREHCTARGCDGTKCEICRTVYPLRRTAMPSTRIPVGQRLKAAAEKLKAKKKAASKKLKAKLPAKPSGKAKSKSSRSPSARK